MLNDTLKQDSSPVLVNLASNEYAQGINWQKLKAKVITPMFYELKEGELKLVSIFLKKARGLMASFIIKNRISNPEEIILFNHYSDQLKF